MKLLHIAVGLIHKLHQISRAASSQHKILMM
nr:MAG TPA: hypothetical protein [Caudoviricetes sp.]